MKSLLWFLVGGLLVAAIVMVTVTTLKPAVEPAPQVNGGEVRDGATVTDNVIVTSPERHATIASPLTVVGRARGTWFFEASFPVELRDAAGNVLAQTIAVAQSNWMTTEFVDFQATLSFVSPSGGGVGTLVLRKDNPSGLPEYDAAVEVPVIFSTEDGQTMNISLYYYDANRDKDQSGNLLCSAQGLVTLERTVPMFAKEIDRITAAVRLLLAGDITKEEVTRGVTSEFPLSGVTLTNVTIDDDGVVTLSFEDPLLKTSGGSCRVAILWAQISATVRQFPGVTDVRFAPEELFQP